MITVNNVSHILYPATDVAKSIEFLSKTLGFYVQERGSTTYLGCGDAAVAANDRGFAS